MRLVMRHLLRRGVLVAALLGLAASPVLAQGRDTVFAVHKLFQQKRRSGASWASAGTSAAFDHSLGYRAGSSTRDNVAQATVFGGVPLAVGLLQYGRFSPERETQVLAAYAQGQPLPPDIRRRLRRRHFRRTAKDRGLP